jgi:glycosyltransferase involved in cell wall biosynthesis
LAPLRFGAGIKGKFVEAMQCGTPSVTTAIGAESMHANLPWNGFVSDNADELVSNAVELYLDENLWKKAQQNGIEILHKRFMKGIFAADFIERIQYLLSTLEAHRQNNFMGAMLQHHTLKSTKYLSKWITEKNKS